MISVRAPVVPAGQINEPATGKSLGAITGPTNAGIAVIPTRNSSPSARYP
jgi:hypothetical protein